MLDRVKQLLEQTLPDSKEREYYSRYASVISWFDSKPRSLEEILSFFSILEGYEIRFQDAIVLNGPDDPLFISDLCDLFAAFYPRHSEERGWWRRRFWSFCSSTETHDLVDALTSHPDVEAVLYRA